MTVYAYSSGDSRNGAHVLSVTGVETSLTSMFGFGEDVLTGLHGIAINWIGTTTSTSTAEKLNSRSPAPASTYLADSGPGNGRITLSFPSFSHSSWRSHPLRPLLASDGEGHHVDPAIGFPGGSTATKIALFAELRQPATLYRSRRSRNGCFFMLGNDIGHHQKTGGGAFSMRAPHFDNDIMWVDKSVWANGMTQAEVWSMQLFGSVASPAPPGLPVLFAGD